MRWPLQYYELTLTSGWTRFSKLLEIIRAISRKPKPHLVIVDVLEFHTLLIFAIARLARVKFAVRLRGDVWLELNEVMRTQTARACMRALLLLRVSSFLVKHADFLLPVSEYIGKQAVTMAQMDPDKIVVLSTFVDVVKYRALDTNRIPQRKKEMGFGVDDRIILSVTNFDYLKKAEGLNNYVTTFNQLCNTHENIYWVIIGDGRFFNRSKDELLAKIASPDQIKFVGFAEEVAIWYTVCDFLVHFSFADGFPNVVLEAGASGKACLANHCGGMPEQIVDGVTGLLVDADDVRAITSASIRLLDDLTYRRRLGERASERVGSTYSVQAVGFQFENALSSIL